MKVPLWAKVVFGLSVVGGSAIFARKVIFKRKPAKEAAEQPKAESKSEPEPEKPTSTSKRWFEASEDSAAATVVAPVATDVAAPAATAATAEPLKTTERHGIERLVKNEHDLKLLKEHPYISNMLDDITAFYALDKAAFMGVLNGCLELLDLEAPDGMPKARWSRIKPRAVAKITATIVRALRDLRSKLTDAEQKKTFDAAASEIQQICNDHQFNAFQDASN